MQNLKESFDYWQNQVSGAVNALQDAELANVEAKYDAEIAAAKKAGKDTTELENKKEAEKLKIQKKLKKLTKVDKKKSWEAQALPLIIYPWRLTERTQNERTSRTRSNSNDVEVVYLKGKQGKYSLKINALGEIKLKNGAKDSFKTGVQQISYDREKGIISANSADIWTGPKGLPVSANRVYDYTKGK